MSLSQTVFLEHLILHLFLHGVQTRGGSRAAGTSKMEHFLSITKRSILDAAAALDPPLQTTHPALRRRGDVAATSLCTSQWHRRYVSNETPNDVSMERRQVVSVVRLHNVLLERHNEVSKGRNKDAPSLRLHDVSNKSQMKHPTTYQWNVAKTS